MRPEFSAFEKYASTPPFGRKGRLGKASIPIQRKNFVGEKNRRKLNLPQKQRKTLKMQTLIQSFTAAKNKEKTPKIAAGKIDCGRRSQR